MAATASFGVPRSGDQGVDALISGWHWNVLRLTYSFPGTKSVYDYVGAPDTFKPLSSPAQIAATAAFDAIEIVHGPDDYARAKVEHEARRRHPDRAIR